MGLIVGLLINPLYLVFLAFLLAGCIELTSRRAAWISLVIGAVVIAVVNPTIFLPAEDPVRFIAAGIVANAIILAVFYQIYVLVLRRLA